MSYSVRSRDGDRKICGARTQLWRCSIAASIGIWAVANDGPLRGNGNQHGSLEAWRIFQKIALEAFPGYSLAQGSALKAHVCSVRIAGITLYMLVFRVASTDTDIKIADGAGRIRSAVPHSGISLFMLCVFSNRMWLPLRLRLVQYQCPFHWPFGNPLRRMSPSG